MAEKLQPLLLNMLLQILDAPVRRLAGPDVPAVPFSHPMQDWFMLNEEKITTAARDLANY